MEPTISRFILFIGVEVLFFIATLLLMIVIGALIMHARKLKNSYALLMNVLLSLVSIFFLFLFLKVLTGESYLGPFMVIFFTSIALMLVVEFVWLIFGSTNIPWFGRAIWAGYEFEQLHPIIKNIIGMCSIIIMLAYPIYIGYGYFGDMFFTPDWKGYVLRSTIVILIGLPMLMVLPQSLNLLISENILEGTRSRVFINQLANSASVLLFFSLFVWSMNASGKTVPILGEHFVFSTTVGYAIAVYLIFFVILPYFIGHFRSKHWVNYLQSQREEILDATSKAFLVPNINNASKVLMELKDLIHKYLGEIEGDKSLMLAYEVSKTNDDENLLYRIGLESSIDRDPRFIHVNNLSQILVIVEECESELEEKETDKSKRETLDAYLKSLGHIKKSEIESSKAWVIILFTSVSGSIISPVISSVGKLVAAKLGLAP